MKHTEKTAASREDLAKEIQDNLEFLKNYEKSALDCFEFALADPDFGEVDPKRRANMLFDLRTAQHLINLCNQYFNDSAPKS